MNSASLQLGRAPPFIVCAGLLIWGWQNQFLIYAAGMALALEAAHWASWRWPVTDREFNHVSDLSSVIFLVVVVYVFSEEGAKGIFLILALLPFVFFLLLLVQVYSDAGQVRLSALFVSLRRLDPRFSPEAQARVDLSLPYFATCLISASAGNQQPGWFFFTVCVLVGAVLWTVRPRRYPAPLWFTMLCLAVALGYAGQIGLTRLQAAAESSLMQVFERFMWRYRDPNRATTAIGSLGRLKLSDRILLRVKTDRPLTAPLLLREAAYDTYGYGIWSNQDYEFTPIDPDATGNIFLLNTAPTRDKISLSTYLTEDTGIVPLPLGATRIRDAGATEVTRNRYGAVRAEIREGWVRYTAEYGGQADPDTAPTERDLYIAESYREDFRILADRLGLGSKRPADVVSAVRAFFADGFTYSLTQRHRYPRGRYLAEFLFGTRSGHCEFYATSTVLLLRAAGVPARYVVGFSIDEYSRLEGQYVGRARHSHSWAQAYVDGKWQVLDTTPSVWSPLEEEGASALAGVFDLWAWAAYRLSRWQSKDALEEESDNETLLWLLIPLAAVLAWRLYFKERVARSLRPDAAARPPDWPGLDSSFYELIRALEGHGFIRRPGETLAAGISRMQAEVDLEPVAGTLAMHYRYRFDPAGISTEEKRSLDAGVRRALSSLASRPAAA